MMKIFFDFDDTLFDTRSFADSIQGIFEEYGISKELFWNSYEDMKGKSLLEWCYSPETQIIKLNQDYSFDGEQLRKKLGMLISDTRKFLFPEVEKSLSFLKKTDYVLYILSFGDHDFQMSKIKGTGIDRFMEKIIIARSNKADVLKEETINNDGTTWFVDDRIEFIECVKKSLPKIRTIFMKRRGRRNQNKPNEFCDYVVKDLIEAEKILIHF